MANLPAEILADKILDRQQYFEKNPDRDANFQALDQLQASPEADDLQGKFVAFANGKKVAEDESFGALKEKCQQIQEQTWVLITEIR